MSVKLLTEHLLEVVSFKEGCTGSSESTLIKMPHCWKSHALAHLVLIACGSSSFPRAFAAHIHKVGSGKNESALAHPTDVSQSLNRFGWIRSSSSGGESMMARQMDGGTD